MEAWHSRWCCHTPDAVASLGHWKWSGTQPATAGDLHAVRLGCLQREVDGAVRSDAGAWSASYIRFRRGCGLRFTRSGDRCPRAQNCGCEDKSPLIHLNLQSVRRLESEVDSRVSPPQNIRQPKLGVTLSVGRSASVDRSEEHTSELQSQPNLVCRL